MNRLYRLTEDGRERWRRRMLREMLTIFAGAEVFFIAVLAVVFPLEGWHYLILAVLALLMLLLAAARFWMNPGTQLKDWGLYLDEQEVYLTHAADAPRIPLSDLREVRRTRHGALLIGRENRFFIPEGAEDFEVLLETLRRCTN